MFGRYLPVEPDNKNCLNEEFNEKTMIIEYVFLKHDPCRYYHLSSDYATYPRPESQKACIFL